MATRINGIHIRHYRALADVRLDLGPVGVLFGPNGPGKSTLLDTHNSRSFFLHRLKTQGSESSPDTRLSDRGDNAWSVLRNVHDHRNRDYRFDTITQFMREAFPSFEDIMLEQTGPSSVHSSFYEKNRAKPILASGVSDGHLQLLLILTALFSEGPDRAAQILLDEPEISLYPWALAVLAKAIREAGNSWDKQVFVATHSPVLISQFEPHEIIATETEGGRARLRRVSEIEGVQDLLEQYAAGSLYMSETIGFPIDFSCGGESAHPSPDNRWKASTGTTEAKRS
jgi:predicted ATPase